VLLKRLVDQIHAQNHHGVEVQLYTDSIGGRENFYSLIGLIFEEMKDETFDYWIHLPDDVELRPDFFSRATSHFDTIRRYDPRSVTLNPLRLQSDYRRQWTDFVPRRLGQLWQTQQVDCCWIADRQLGDALEWRIDEVHPARFTYIEGDPVTGSGVGSQMSQRLHEQGYTMYGVSETLLSHGDHESLMNPEERKRNPLTTA